MRKVIDIVSSIATVNIPWVNSVAFIRGHLDSYCLVHKFTRSLHSHASLKQNNRGIIMKLVLCKTGETMHSLPSNDADVV